jgi:microcystin-dependent protein
MANPFCGQIALFPYNYAPRNWMFCQGQTVPYASFTTLAALLGQTFGGNGTTTVGLPDLRGRAVVGAVPPGFGANYLGAMYGSENVQLDKSTFGHTHAVTCTSNPGTTTVAVGNQFATARGGPPLAPNKGNIYIPDTGQPDIQLGPDNIVPSAGGGQPHNNMQPYLTMNYCIAVNGLYPPRG